MEEKSTSPFPHDHFVDKVPQRRDRRWERQKAKKVRRETHSDGWTEATGDKAAYRRSAPSSGPTLLDGRVLRAAIERLIADRLKFQMALAEAREEIGRLKLELQGRQSANSRSTRAASAALDASLDQAPDADIVAFGPASRERRIQVHLLGRERGVPLTVEEDFQ